MKQKIGGGLRYYRPPEKILKKGDLDLLVLDEINFAAAIGLVNKKRVLEVLDKAPEKTNIVLTGRRAPKSFIKKADYVMEFRAIKRPKKIETKKGIEW